MVNGHRDLQIGTQVALEILSADRIDFLCAFVRWAGLRLIRRELEHSCFAVATMRVIASVYTGSTERKALDDLVGLGAQVKISYDTSQTRLHAKAWLFERNSGFDTAYVGSSYPTHSALVDGLEWNVRVTATDNSAIVDRIGRLSTSIGTIPSSSPTIRESTASASRRHLTLRTAPSQFRPVSAELHCAEALPSPDTRGTLRRTAARSLRNIVVAPTGTGKTWVSAFDYQRLRNPRYERLLFVAHRDEILQQSQAVFRLRWATRPLARDSSARTTGATGARVCVDPVPPSGD